MSYQRFGIKRTRLCIEREALTVESCRNRCDFEEPRRKTIGEELGTTLKKSLKCDKEKAKTFIKRKIPIFDWLLGYDRSWLMGDVIAGVTMSVIHIPQGIGFAMLANIPPISGLYMAFFPCIIYALFASSRHNSMGTFAIITMMTGKVVNEYATFPSEGGAMNETISDMNGSELSEDIVQYTPIQIATIVTFMVGVWQMIFGFLQLGRLCIFLSDTVISAFTTAAAFYVILSQIKFVMGVTIPFYSGLLKFTYTVIALCKEVPSANVASLIIAAVTMTILIINNELVKPRLAKITRIPLPIETIVIIIGTFASYFGDFSTNFSVKTVNNIPTGLPAPTLPPMEMIGKVAMDSFTIALVAYIINFSVAKIFANKHDYVIDSNQELYAQGLGNLFGSFFSCAPIAVALIRPVLIDQIGGKTQLVSLIAAGIMIPMLLWVGPLLEPLPNAVFASIIIVTLKGMVMQIEQLFSAWKLSKIDGITWLTTFVCTILLDIEYGLMVGILFSLFVLLNRNQSSSGKRLGCVKSLNIFLDVQKYPQAKEIPGFLIYQICGSLHFANRTSLETDIMKSTGLNPSVIVKKMNNNLNGISTNGHHSNGHHSNGHHSNGKETNGNAINMTEVTNDSNGKTPIFSLDIPATDVTHLILDMSCVSSVDIAAGKHLGKIRANYDRAGIILCLAGMTESVFSSLDESAALNCFSTDHLFYSVLDAVAILSEKNRE